MVTRLKELREARFLSQADLAEKAGVGKNTVWRIELGEATPSYTTIRKLAEALGVEPGELVPDMAAYSEARRRAPRKTAAKAEEADEAEGA